MSVSKHRVASASVLLSGVVGLLVWGWWMGLDSPEVAADRDRLQGPWVATLVQATENNKAQGDSASACRIAFEGRSVVIKNLIEGGDARGTYVIDPTVSPSRIDFKLDVGWIIGLYSVDRDSLVLCVTPMTMPERLGVPSRPRPQKIHPGPGRHQYEFRRLTPAGRQGIASR